MKKTKVPIALRLVLHATLTRVGICVAALIAGCATPPPPSAPFVVVLPPVAPPVAPPAFTGKVSNAQTPREYRRDAAAHLYEKNAGRIFAGKMLPLLYAVGVLQIDIDERGNLTKVSWMRAPTKTPEVMTDVERSVRAAAPFPAPIKMGRVTYTDTWLWHKSGRFQLDTLTEGQL